MYLRIIQLKTIANIGHHLPSFSVYRLPFASPPPLVSVSSGSAMMIVRSGRHSAPPEHGFRGNLAGVEHVLDLAVGEGPLVDAADQEVDPGCCRRRFLTRRVATCSVSKRFSGPRGPILRSSRSPMRAANRFPERRRDYLPRRFFSAFSSPDLIWSAKSGLASASFSTARASRFFPTRGRRAVRRYMLLPPMGPACSCLPHWADCRSV